MPGEKGLEAGRRLGLHDVPGGAARGGPAYVVSTQFSARFPSSRRCSGGYMHGRILCANFDCTQRPGKDAMVTNKQE
jgi:hypothetical protein